MNPDVNLVTLENDVWKLEVVPEVGASIYGLSTKLDGVWQPIMRPTTLAALAAKKSSVYRIRDATFKFRGREYQLRSTTADGGTQHGDVRNRPWRVEKVGNALKCEFDSRDFVDFNFPFAFTMRVTYSLDGSNFLSTLELENVSCPPGLGFTLILCVTCRVLAMRCCNSRPKNITRPTRVLFRMRQPFRSRPNSISRARANLPARS